MAGDPQFKTSVVSSPVGVGKVYTEIDAETGTKTEATKAIDTGGSQANAIAYISASAPTDPNYVFEKWTARRNAESAGTWATMSWTSYLRNATAPIIAKSDDSSKPDWTEFTAVYTLAGAVRVQANDETRGEARISKVNNAVGETVTLTAIPCSFTGTFTGWRYEATGEIVSTDLEYSFTVTEANKGTYTAVYDAFNIGNGCYVMLRNSYLGDYLGLLGNNDDVSSSQRYFRNSILLGTGERVHASPAFVLYMTGTPDTHQNLYDIDLAAQGTSIKGNPSASDGELSFYKILDQYYHFRGKFYGMIAFMEDNRFGPTHQYAHPITTEECFGEMHHPGAFNGATMNNNLTETNPGRYLWEIVRMTEDNRESYFGALPSANTVVNGGYWTTMYAAFPFKCLDGVKAFVVSSVSKNGTLQLSEITSGIVPANTPVLLRCNSTQTVNNRLFPVNQTVAAYTGTNYLKGEIWIKDYEKQESAYRKSFDATTMRVLSYNACSFDNVNNTDYLSGGGTGVLPYIANNTAYLDLSSITEADRQTSYTFGGSISPVVSDVQTTKISVSITPPTTESAIEYKIGENGTWQTYTGPFDLNQTATVYARFTDNAFGTTEVSQSYEFESLPEFAGEGYYRVRNYDTGRYVNITGNASNLSSIGLADDVADKPGSVIYIKKAETDAAGFDLSAQGASTADYTEISVGNQTYNIPQPVYITRNGSDVSPLYNAYVHSDEYSLDAYFQDANGSGTINPDLDAARSGAYDNTKWYIEPFTAEGIDHNFFTVRTQVHDDTYRYATLTVDFNYEIITQNVNAYYATAVDAYGNLTLSEPLTKGDIVPAGEPMILRWPASYTADIQLLPTLRTAATVTGNVLQRAIKANSEITYFETPVANNTKYFGTLSIKNGQPGFYHDVEPDGTLNGNRAYTANEVYEVADLTELAASTHIGKRHVITGDALTAAYYNASLGGKPTIFAKDNNLWSPKDENTNELTDYVTQKGFQTTTYDQSHWIQLQLPEAKSHSNGQQLTGLYGVLVDNTNLHLNLLEQPTVASGTSYTPNSYLAANFNKAGNTGVWLENPQQPQQYATIRYARWDATKQAFVMPGKNFDIPTSSYGSSWNTIAIGEDGLTGGFKANMTYAPTDYNALSKLHHGRIYDISSAIIKREESNGTPAGINNQMVVYPIAMEEIIPAYTLADALADTELGTGPDYTIMLKGGLLTCADVFLSTSTDASTNPAYLYCKEDASSQTWPAPAEGEWDFLKYVDGDEFKAVEDCDQSLWIKLIVNKFAYTASNAGSYAIKRKLEGLRGYFTDKTNPEFQLTIGSSPSYHYTSSSAYTLTDKINTIIPPNFGGSQTADNGKNYFFMQPRPMEIVHLTWAVWDKNAQAFVIPQSQTVNGVTYNEAGLHGGVRADFSLCGTDLYLTNGGAKLTAADMDAYHGQAFSFRALVKRATSSSPAPRRANTINGDVSQISNDWVLCPLDLDPDNANQIVTGVKQVTTDARVVGVEYVNAAGLRSTRPWKGVNIVVTRYDNGTTQTSKRVF